MKKAFGYIRVSSIGQSGEGKDGYTRQEKKISQYCEQNNIQLVRSFYDSETGTRENRKSLSEMMYIFEKNNIDVKTVIIENLSRLSRDLSVQLLIVEKLKKLNITIVCIDENRTIDKNTNSSADNFILNIFGSVYQFEKEALVEKLRVARQRKREKTGKCEGRKSYIEKNPDVIKRIKQLRRKRKGYDRRMSYSNIAAILNGEGYQTLTPGKKFTANLISNLDHSNR